MLTKYIGLTSHTYSLYSYRECSEMEKSFPANMFKHIEVDSTVLHGVASWILEPVSVSMRNRLMTLRTFCAEEANSSDIVRIAPITCIWIGMEQQVITAGSVTVTAETDGKQSGDDYSCSSAVWVRPVISDQRCGNLRRGCCGQLVLITKRFLICL